MAVSLAPSSDPIDMTTGRLRPEWRVFFNQVAGAVNSTLDTVSGLGTSTLQQQLTQEIADRKAADALLLPKDMGITGRVGFQGTFPTERLSVIGSRGGNAALQTLLIQLARYGLITDNTT